jgi:hypothetical protein
MFLDGSQSSGAAKWRFVAGTHAFAASAANSQSWDFVSSGYTGSSKVKFTLTVTGPGGSNSTSTTVVISTLPNCP